MIETGKTVHGIKGPTPLLELEDFDFIRGTVPDYLHSVCHGGIRFFLHLWTDKTNHKEPWYLNNRKRSILNARLGQMKPPYDVTRTCRPLNEINLWKASEFRSFALYYYPALEDLLPAVYYKHFQKLIHSFQVLLQEKVPLATVKDCQILIDDFLREALVLYGLQHMRFNLHLFKHLVQSCIDWGCLWASSTFIPEWFNGVLITSANGTQEVASQMAHSHLIRNVIRKQTIDLIQNHVLPKPVCSLLKEFLQIPDWIDGTLRSETLNSTLTECGLRLLGQPQREKMGLSFKISLLNLFSSSNDAVLQHILPDGNDLDVASNFKRLQLQNKVIFTTVHYTRSPKRNNYCALMDDGEFLMIEKIIHFPNVPSRCNVFVIGRLLGVISKTKLCPGAIGDLSFDNLPGQTTELKGLDEGLTAYCASSIFKKCVFFFKPICLSTFYHDDCYIATAVPNSVETD